MTTGASAAGIFSGATSVVGFDSGVVLSTGKMALSGTNNIFSSGYSTNYDSATGGTVPSGYTYASFGFGTGTFNDISMLSFDINAAAAGYVSFQYCVASEEYPEYLDYADSFVLDVNGTNFVTIPNTTTGVSIGTVNPVAVTPKHLERTKDNFMNVYEGINHSTDQVEQIAGITKELNNVRTNVVDIINNLSAISEENVASTEETAAVTAQLSTTVNDIGREITSLRRSADELVGAVSMFKL